MQHTPRKHRRARAKRRRALWWTLGIIAFVVVVIGTISAIILPKALQARAELTASIPLVSEIQASVLAGDTEAAAAQAATLTSKTQTARDATSGFVWRALEWVPVAGPNLAAVRIAAEATDEIADNAVVPVSGLSLASFTPKDGKLDLAAVEGMIGTVDGIATSVHHAEGLMDAVDRSVLIGPVASGVDQLDEALAKVSTLLTDAEPFLDALPNMLGADGPRDILIIFQNNGEVMPGGGTIGSLAQMHIDNGAIDVAEQASAGYWDFPPASETVIEIPRDAKEFYGSLLGRYVQSLTRTPRFDLTFDIAREMWERKTGVTVDAVVAVDVVMLAQLLRATGPVELDESLTLTADNAVGMLLGDLYYDHTPEEVDEINQAFAAITMDRLFSGDVSVPDLLAAVATAADDGRIRMWSSRANEQELIQGTAVDHRGLASSTESAELGFYFMDATPGKMQRFMQQAVTIENADCGATRTVRATVALTNSVDPELVPVLPDYVRGSGKKTPFGTIRLSTLVYAPPGFTYVSGDAGGEVALEHIGTDGEYSVIQMQVLIDPRQTRTLTFEFTTDNRSATVSPDVTPVVNPTTQVAAGPCSA